MRNARRFLLASTALTAFAFAIAGTSQEAMAACTPTVTSAVGGVPISTNSSESFRFQNGGNATINIGAGGGNGTYANNCVLDMVNRQGDTVNITVPAVTTFADGIVMDDATTGTVINVSSNLGAGTNAILDGTGSNTVNINSGANVSADINMGGGSDTLNFNNGTFSGGSSVNLGEGNDTLRVSSSAWFISQPVMSGGGGTDTIEYVANGGTVIFPGTSFIDNFQEFENLVVSGTSTGNLVIRSTNIVTSTMETVTVNSATLTLQQQWTITGAGGLIVNAGGTLRTSVPVATPSGTTVDVTNGVTIRGNLTVGNVPSGTGAGPNVFNANGVTTIDGGTLTVEATGATYNAIGGIVGSANTDTIIVSGVLNITGGANLGAGDDLFQLDTGGTVTGTVDGGGHDTGDILRLGGGGTGAIDFATSPFTGFELLEKTDVGTWTASAAPGGTSFLGVAVADGTLILVGNFSFTGNTTTVDPGATMDIGDGVTPTVVDEAGDAKISGTLNVTNNATFNVAGTTTVFDGGEVNIDVTGTMTINVLDIQAGGMVSVDGTLQGTAGADTVTVTGQLDAIGTTIDLRGGDDEVTVSGSLTVDLLDLGAGDDTLTIVDTFSSIGFVEIDGGANTGVGDTLVFTASAASNTFFVGLNFFVNFEHLVKEGTTGWTLLSTGGTATFETLTVNAGTLTLVGSWDFTGNTTTVAANATYNVGNGANATVINEAGDTDVSGTLNVTNNATFNSGDGAGDVTTVFDGGTINVNTGATPGVLNAVDVDVQQGGAVNVDGTMTVSATTTVRGTLTIGATGDYAATGLTQVRGPFGRLVVNAGGVFEATGAVLAQSDGIDVDPSAGLFVLGGQFTAKSTTSLDTFGQIVIDNGGAYIAEGATSLMSISQIVVEDGLYHAQTTTTLASLGSITVNGGEYRATGAVLMGSITKVTVNGGLFHAQDTTALTVFGEINVAAGGEYRATGAVDLSVGSKIDVTGGLFDAQSTTTVSNESSIVVSGGRYTAQGLITLNDDAKLQVMGAGIVTASGGITVNGGTVFGDGTINGGQMMNNVGGTVAPGNSIGTLTFVGDYVQAAGGTFEAELQPGGATDLFAITGTAALGGTVDIVNLGGAFGGLERFRIISTTTPIPTIFDSATATNTGDTVVWVGRVDDAGMFNEADPATGNNVDVLIGTSPAAEPNLTPNQAAVADVVGGAIAALPPGAVVIEDVAIYNALMVSAFGPNALDQIGGEVYDSFTAFSFNIARQYGGLVDNRVRTLRCASARGPSAPFCGSGQTLLADAGPGLAPGAPGTTSPNGFSPNTHPYGWSVWAQAIGSYISLDRTSENLGYSGWTGGGAIGVDLALSQRWIVGVMAGGTRSNIDFSGVSGDGDLEAVTVGVYTAWYGSRWFANAAFTYSKTWVEADRDLTFMTPNTTAKGKTEGDQYAAHATVGYGFKLKSISLEATGGIDWVQLRQYGFTETGAGAFNLTVGTRTDDSLRLRIGIRAARAWKVRPNLIIAPSIRVGYAREVLDNTRPITSSLAGFGGSFTVNGDEGSRNILTYGGGVQADFSQGITLYFRHSGEWAGDRTSHTFNGGIKVRW